MLWSATSDRCGGRCALGRSASAISPSGRPLRWPLIFSRHMPSPCQWMGVMASFVEATLSWPWSGATACVVWLHRRPSRTQVWLGCVSGWDEFERNAGGLAERQRCACALQIPAMYQHEQVLEGASTTFSLAVTRPNLLDEFKPHYTLMKTHKSARYNRILCERMR